MAKEKQRSFTRERSEFLYITKNLSTREVAEKLNESKRVIEYVTLLKKNEINLIN